MGTPALASRMAGVRNETAFDVLSEVMALQAQGRSIVSFAIGEPGFATPELVKQAGLDAIAANDTKYAPTAGLPEVRAAIAEYAGGLRGLSYDGSEVVITPGAKPILFYGLLALANPGDGVVYPTPCFPIYESVMSMVGAVGQPVPLRRAEEFHLTPVAVEAAATPETRGLLLNSPGNPCGNVYRQRDLEGLAKLAVERDWWVISDEIYSRLVYGTKHVSIASFPGMRERTLLLDGHSKSFAMTGWRFGYGLGPREWIEAVALLVVNSVSCTAPFTQRAAMAAMQGAQDECERRRNILGGRRAMVLAGLNGLRGFHCEPPRGAFYVWADVADACDRLGLVDDAALQQWLLHEHGVAVLHRGCFGHRLPDETEHYLRFSYAGETQALEDGLRRLHRALG